MTEGDYTVCALCGKGLAQPYGSKAMKHGHVYGPTMCDGWGITVMWRSEWEAWQNSPIGEFDL